MKLTKEQKEIMKKNAEKYNEEMIKHPGVAYMNQPIYVALESINDSIKELTAVLKSKGEK